MATKRQNKKSVEPFRIHSIEVLEDLRQIEYDRYSTLDDMKLVVEYDVRRYHCRAERLCRCPCQKIFQISMLDNAKTLSLICLPPWGDNCEFKDSFLQIQHSSIGTKETRLYMSRQSAGRFAAVTPKRRERRGCHTRPHATGSRILAGFSLIQS